MKQMAFLEYRGHSRIYCCDGCGKIAGWEKGWQSYSSIAIDETCPEDAITVCSVGCAVAVGDKLKSGEIKMPVLRKARGYLGSTRIRERIGY